MKRCGLFLLVLAATAWGCGEEPVDPEKVYNPTKMAGEVDTSLPAALQARQEALRTILAAIQLGTEFDSLADHYPNIRFQEPIDKFLEGTLNLDHWDFNGKPQGNDMPVVLFLNEDSSGTRQRRVERVYSVSGAGGQFVIMRR